MKKNRWIKTGADMVILLCSVILCVQIYFESHRLEQSLLIFICWFCRCSCTG